MQIRTKTTRPKSPTIETIPASAPWVLVSRAAKESGLTDLLIRKSGVPIRTFGNANYVRSDQLNAWILADGKEETQPGASITGHLV